jgi:hypothetical protein
MLGINYIKGDATAPISKDEKTICHIMILAVEKKALY